jgi:hypothetical protein
VRLFKMPSDQHASAWPVDTMLVFSASSTPGALGNTGVAAGGTPEIFVRPLPVANAGGVVKVSSGGGGSARWSGDGRTIYYVALDLKTVRAVHVTIGAAVSVGATETVMTVPGLGNGWDVNWKTGKIHVTQAVGGDPARVVVIQHWLDDFRRSQEGRP